MTGFNDKYLRNFSRSIVQKKSILLPQLQKTFSNMSIVILLNRFYQFVFQSM